MGYTPNESCRFAEPPPLTLDPEAPTITAEDLQNLCTGFARSLDHVMPETRATYIRALREFSRWHGGTHGFRFTVTDVQRYQRYLVEERKFASVSVSTYLTALRQFLAYLVRRGLLEQNPATSIRGSERPVAHSRASLSDADVQTLLAVISQDHPLGTRDLGIVRLMLDCGLSEIEIVRSNVGDLMMTDEGQMLRVQGKGRRSKDAILSVPPIAYEAMVRYLSTRKSVLPEEPLFESAGNRTRGMRMTTRGIRDRVARYLALAGITRGRDGRITPYSLRHTAGRVLADAGATADEIQRRMRLGTAATAKLYLRAGHSSRQE